MVISRYQRVDEKTIKGENHTFLLLFHHKLEEFNFFKDYNDFLFSNSKNKFSIFGYFDDCFKIGDRFYFLFEYPEQNCHLFFSQKVNPLKAEHNSEVNVEEHDATCPNPYPFTGLTKYKEFKHCYLDGSAQDKSPDFWLYSVDQRTNWTGDSYQLPGFTSSYEPKLMEVNLWVEIKDLTMLNRLFRKYTCKRIIVFPHSISYYLISLFSFFVTQ